MHRPSDAGYSLKFTIASYHCMVAKIRLLLASSRFSAKIVINY